jgi:hypothetical protein
MSGKKQGEELIYRGISHVTVLKNGLAHQPTPPSPTTTDDLGLMTAGKRESIPFHAAQSAGLQDRVVASGIIL